MNAIPLPIIPLLHQSKHIKQAYKAIKMSKQTSTTSTTSQLKVFEEMLKDLKEQVLSEMRASSPDDGKIARLAQDIENLDLKIDMLKTTIATGTTDATDIIDEVSKETMEGETKEDTQTLTAAELAKVRWAYTPGEKNALGCITLNPNKRQTTNSQTTNLISAMDVSNSMGDDPLIEMSNEMIKMIEDLISGGANVRCTLIAYGKESNVFIDEVLITRDNFNSIKKEIKKNIGDPWMGKIRSDTRFEKPLCDMFERGTKYGKDTIYVWWSDGIEEGWSDPRRTAESGPIRTNMTELVKRYFPDGPTGKMCTATYKNRCGENTQMQELANIWGDDGFFTNIDTIASIAKFTKESLYDSFFSTMAEDINIVLPTGEERKVSRVKQIPIDITFTCPVTLELRVGATSQFALKDTLYPEISITCSTSNGETHTFTYPYIDQVQINPSTGVLVSSANTQYAHKLQRFNILQDDISGLSDDAAKDLPLLKEARDILQLAGNWKRNGKFEPCVQQQGTKANGAPHMVNVAADHQRQAKVTYEETEKCILAATRIMNGIAEEQDRQVYRGATRAVAYRSMQAVRGQSQNSGYSAQTSAYGSSINNTRGTPYDSSSEEDSSDVDASEDDDFQNNNNGSITNVPMARVINTSAASHLG